MTIEEKYAELLIDYCLEVKKGHRLFIKSTPLAEPLLREVYRLAVRRGALTELDLSIEGQTRIFFEEAKEDLIRMISPVEKYRFEHYDKYLNIRAPYNLSENRSVSADKLKIRSEAIQPVIYVYFVLW